MEYERNASKFHASDVIDASPLQPTSIIRYIFERKSSRRRSSQKIGEKFQKE